MRIAVQKFGGTSVATDESREQVARHIKEFKAEGYGVVVVLSAIGRKGDPYATDTLIGLARKECFECDQRELDLLMSCGEIISCIIMAHRLRRMGIDSVALTGAQAGIMTDGNFGDARIIGIDIQKILKHLERGKVVIVAGFQGGTKDGEVNTLGRGGSDTTAAALGVALDAEIIDIYTDVEGIMTADPRLVPDAQILENASYNEICQMAHLGAKVIHPRAVEIAMQKNIPMRVRSTFSDAMGTLIANNVIEGTMFNEDSGSKKLITGIAHIPNIVQLNISFEAVEDSASAELELFESFAEAGISIDLINVYPDKVLFTIGQHNVEQAKAILEKLSFAYTMKNELAKVSVVGAGMRGTPGVMAKVVAALHNAGIDILQSADSHTTISCLVEQSRMADAMKALHDKFSLNDN